MANKNRNLIIAYFPSSYKAEKAAEHLKTWDQNRDDVKLGGMGIITEDEDGKLKTRKVGARAGGTGAKWGVILGAAAGILSGGITLIGGAIVGLAGGAVAGALFHKRLGMEDEDKERLMQHLKDGGAALAVMADDEEVEPTKFELLSLNGEVESYTVPGETMEELEAAAAEEGFEELDEAVLVEDESAAEQVATAAAAAVVAEAVAGDDEDGEVVVVEETAVVEEAVVDDAGAVEAVAEAVVVAEVVQAAATDEETEDSPRQAILHFKRYNGDYDGWGIHVWSGYEGQVYWGKPLPPAGMDDFGLYFEVPLADGAEGLAYIIHRGDEKDHWDDQYLNFGEHGTEVWIVQNMAGYVARP